MLGFKGKKTQNLTRIHIGPLEVNYVKIPSQESHVINPSYSAVWKIYTLGNSDVDILDIVNKIFLVIWT